MRRTFVIILLALLVASPLLSACGKRGSLEHPPGEKSEGTSQYPSR